MERSLKRKILHIEGMTCTNCETRIEKALQKLDGVAEVKAIFSKANVYLTYDAKKIDLAQIIDTIEKLDYTVRNKPGAAAVAANQKAVEDKRPVNWLLGAGAIIFALYVLLNNTAGFNFIPEINHFMGYGVLFIAGLLTSLHCLAMCGGINLSQCLSLAAGNNKSSLLAKLKPSLLYNGGRVISYTVIGGIVGALGSIITLSGAAKGIVAIVSGAFMIIMGLNMLNVFPWLRKITPRMPKFFGGKIQNGAGKYGPLYIGLLNGFMPCGPLQAMQIYALGTGSFTAGAMSMFVFSLGTVPVMFGLGAVSSLISSQFTRKMMKISAALVIVLGIVMTNRGLALSGFPLPFPPLAFPGSTQDSNIATIKNGVQVVTTKLYPGSYEPVIVQKGIPVKWIIKAQKSDLNGCNNEIVIPKFHNSQKLEPGDNVIEFTPMESGTFPYSCWMGMIRSQIIVVDDLNKLDVPDLSGGSNITSLRRLP